MSPPLVSIALVTFNGESASSGTARIAAAADPSGARAGRLRRRIDRRHLARAGALRPRFEARGIAVRLLRNPRNLGLRKNVEQALRQCTGAWIAPCDQDDIWRPDKIERLLDFAEDATLVYSDSELIDQEGNRWRRACPTA